MYTKQLQSIHTAQQLTVYCTLGKTPSKYVYDLVCMKSDMLLNVSMAEQSYVSHPHNLSSIKVKISVQVWSYVGSLHSKSSITDSARATFLSTFSILSNLSPHRRSGQSQTEKAGKL